MNEKLKFRNYLGYAACDMANNMAFCVMSSYLSVYCSDILGISGWVISAIMIAARIWDGINDPIMGFLAQAKKPGKGGKYRPFLLFGGYPLAVSAVLVYLQFTDNLTFNTDNSFIPPGKDRLGFDGYFAGYNFHHRYYSPYAYYHLDTPEKIFCSKYEPDEQTDMAISRIKEHKKSGKPFALFLSIGTPHDPWKKENVPEEYYKLFRDTDFPNPPNYRKHNDIHADAWARFLPGKRKELEENRRVYYSMVANLDMNIGRLWNAVREEGLEDNTVFVFTSDHGEMFGAQGRHAKNIFYDEAIRVPCLVRWGDRLPKVRNTTCYNSVDIMPTLLSLMGLTVPDEAEGNDISESIISGRFMKNNSLLMGTGPTAIYGNGFEWRGLRTERYTYAVYRISRKEFLFDNIKDPFQLDNLAKNPEYKNILDNLKAEMYEMMDGIGDRFRKNSYYRKNWIEDRKIKEKLIP